MLDKRLAKEALIHWKHWIKLFLFSTAGAICTVYAAYYLATIIDGIFLQKLSLEKVVPLFAVLLFLVSARAIVVWCNEASARTVAEHIKTDLRLKLLRRLAARGPIALAEEQTGELLTIITDGVEQLDGYFTKFLPQLLVAAAAVPTILIATLSQDLITAAIFIVTVPLIPIFMYLIGRLADDANQVQWKTLNVLNARLFDLMEGLGTLKLFGQSRAQINQITLLDGEFRGASLKVLRVAFLSSFVLELAATLSVAVVAVTIGLRLLEGHIDFARSFFLLLLAPVFYLPLRQLGGAFHSAASGVAAMERIDHVLTLPGKTTPPKSVIAGNDLKKPMRICFDNVYFSYEQRRGDALTGFNMAIEPGERIAIVGASGAGKTTALYLLLQFIHPLQGKIWVNNQALSGIPPEIWRKNIAYIPQSPHIFRMSAAENIALGKPDATMEEIRRAAVAAAAHEFIEALPSGYQTVLGDGGQRLSGGQTQRIAIARAFLQDAPLVLFDEGMAGLDIETETVIETALANLLHAEYTLVTIVHRLHSAKRADKIIVLENGRTVECGAHEALLQKRGHYAALLAAGGGASCASS